MCLCCCKRFNYAYGRLPPAHFTSSTTVRSSMYDNFHTYCICTLHRVVLYYGSSKRRAVNSKCKQEGPAQPRVGTQIRRPMDIRASQWPAGAIRALRKIVASFEPARFSKCQQISANVSKCQQMSANVSKCQQMSANVSIRVHFVLVKICFLSATVSKCPQVSKCQQIWFFCQQVSAKWWWRRHIQFSTSQTSNGHGFRLRPERICASVTTKGE